MWLLCCSWFKNVRSSTHGVRQPATRLPPMCSGWWRCETAAAAAVNTRENPCPTNYRTWWTAYTTALTGASCIESTTDTRGRMVRIIIGQTARARQVAATIVCVISHGRDSSNTPIGMICVVCCVCRLLCAWCAWWIGADCWRRSG